MHVDGAFGASALLSDSLREHLAGIENSDSLSWNAHKWMMQTYACSMALQTLGNDAMGSVLDHGCDMADLAESLIRKEFGWEISAPSSLGIVNFRYVGHGDLSEEK